MVSKLPRGERGVFKDIPELPETFADSINRWSYDGHTLRIEFTVTRFDWDGPDSVPASLRYPVCRLVLSPKAAAELIERLQKFSGETATGGMAHGPAPRPKAPH
jgi:hypothetical protein